MSVHVVYTKEGRKMMRPILTREEYMKLRDSEQNRRADKQHMVQMNYSCMGPVGEGEEMMKEVPLRGCKTASNTVGMDVDLDEEHNAQEKQTHALRDTILQKKQELGLLMLEESATKGYHLVFRRRPELSQEENLRWASSLLGVEYDRGAKDITRVFFTPADKLLFLDEEVFSIKRANDKSPLTTQSENTLTPQRGNNDSNVDEGEASVIHIADTSEGGAFCSKAFDLCVEQAGLSTKTMDVWGEHNWHTNLMAVLSVGLPKLMTRAQLEAVVRDKLPNYSKTEDCRKLIEYFYQNYTADRGFMSQALRDINAKAQSSRLGTKSAELDNDGSEAMDADDQEMAELMSGWTPPELPKRLPRLMELLTANYDPRFKEMLLLAALPVLSAHASHFRARYINGKEIGPQQYVAIIGGSGKGKGNCTDLYKEMVEYTLKANDDREWQRVDENTALRDIKANAKERIPKYHPRLRLFETASKSSILELQKNLGRNGMLLGQFSEVDGLTNATRAAYSDISVLLRKGWDGDMHRQYYMSESTCNTYVNMSISLLMAGTVRAMLERMFSANNCEGGLMQRCIPVLVPKAKRTFRPPMQNFLSNDEKKERDTLLLELYQKDVDLGEDTLLLETPLTNNAIGKWYDELEERFNDGLLTEAEADLSHRCGEFMLRAAIPLIALYGKETKEIVNFSRWVGEMAHYTMCRIFGYRVQKDILTAREMLSQRLDGRKTAEPLLSKLPSVFNVKQIKELRVKMGQSADVKMLLSRYCQKGKLERLGNGVFRQMDTSKVQGTTAAKECVSTASAEDIPSARTGGKGNIVTVTKMCDPTSETSN